MSEEIQGIDFEKLLRSIAISDINIFKNYLKDIYRELSDACGSVSLINFQEYYGIHFWISKRLFYFFSGERSHALHIKFSHFEEGFLNLFANLNQDSLIDLIFHFLDCDEESFISFQNVKTILRGIAFDLNKFMSNSQTQLDTSQIDYLLLDIFPKCNPKNKLSLSDFTEQIKTGNSDLFFIVLFYLNLTQPFNQKILEFYRAYSRVDQKDSCIPSNCLEEFRSSLNDDRPILFPKKYFHKFFPKEISDYLNIFKLEVKKPLDESTCDLSQSENITTIPILTSRTLFNEEEFEENIDERAFILPECIELRNKFMEPNPIQVSCIPGKGKQSIESINVILDCLNNNLPKVSQKVPDMINFIVENEGEAEISFRVDKPTSIENNKIRMNRNSFSNIFSRKGSSSNELKNDDAFLMQNNISGAAPYFSISKNTIAKENFFLKSAPTYECFLYKKKEDTGEFTKFWVVLLGRLMFYFKNEKKKKLRGVRVIKDDAVSQKSFTMTSSTHDKKYLISLQFLNKQRLYYCDQVSDFTNIKEHFYSVLRMKKFNDYYTIGKCIHKGSNAYLFTATVNSSKDTVVVKIFQKKKYDNIIESELYSLVKDEIQITKYCGHHQNIVKYIDDFHDENNYYLVTEYIPAGNLNDLIHGRGTLKLHEIKEIIYGITKGIEYLHDMGIIHRDIKTENICLDSRGGDLTCKIIDLGFATYISEKEMVNDSCGTFIFVAPEIMSRSPYGFKADIYSLGITMYFLAYGRLPYYPESNCYQSAKKLVMEKISFKEQIDNRLKDLIKKCTCQESNNRFIISQVLEHPFFN